MIWCALNGFASVWWLGPSFALLTTLTVSRNRAVAFALQTLLSTLWGLGIGPLLTGLISDILLPHFGTDDTPLCPAGQLRHCSMRNAPAAKGRQGAAYVGNDHGPQVDKRSLRASLWLG